MFYSQLCFSITNYYDEIMQWKQKVPEAGLYIWGTGSVAVGVARHLLDHHIEVDGCFVNIDHYNVDSRIQMLGLKIFSLEDLVESGRPLGIVIGHSHYEMAHTLKVYPTIQNIWCLTDVTRPDLEMSESFIREYKIQLQDTYERLADSQSKRNFISYLNAKISGDTTWILRDFQGPSTYFDCDILSLDTYENYLDLGAYDGSSMEAFIAAIRKAGHSEYRIIAIEVQEKMYQLLCERYRDNSRVSIFNRGISDHSGVDRFNIDDQSTCLSSEGGVEMEVTTVDDLCKSVKGITTVKICIGSTIIPILSGAKETIAQSLPKLIISAGIDKRALIDYIPCLENISGGNRYKYYLRFTNAMTEALVLYAIPA